jgi:DNA-binding LytR/AlgR family response regulator
MKLNCIITDDEPVALEILEDYARMVPYLNIVATCKDAMETFEALRNHKVDVLFMDIQMPEITGIDLIRSLKKPPFVVFTTAYPGFAIDGFELDAVDYLLKPISIDRFLRSVDKICSRYETQDKGADPAKQNSTEKKYFFIKSNQEMLKVEFDKINYIQGMENYVRIFCEDKNVISFSTMKNMEEILSPYNFLRVHRSFIVNLDKVDMVRNYVFNIKDKQIITGKSYKKVVSEVMKSYYSA